MASKNSKNSKVTTPPPPYDLESEQFLMPHSSREECEKLIRDQIYKGEIPTPPVSLYFEETFAKYVKDKTEELYNKKSKERDTIYSQYREKLNQKYGSFEARMEHKHNFTHLPPSVKSKIHYYCYEKGHSCGESEIECYYGDIIEIVEEMEKSMKIP